MDKKENIKDTKDDTKKEEIKKVVNNKENKVKQEKKDNNQNINIEKKKEKDTKGKEDIRESKNTELTEKNNINEDEKIENTKLIKNEDIEMDEKKLGKIKEAIKENKEKSKNNEIKKEKYIQIFRNVVIAVMGIAYISINLIGTKRIPQEQYQIDLKVFIILSVISAIMLFEKAFKNDKFRVALLGIELLILGGATIMLLHLYNLQNPDILKYYKYFILAWSVYYIIKCIIIAIKRIEIDKKEVENN